MKTLVLDASEAGSLEKALEVLRQGGAVAFPTDTVYGVGALAFEAEGVKRLYEIKGRSPVKAIPVLLGAVEDLVRVADDPSEQALRLAQRFWPGPLTIVTNRHSGLPESISPDNTVGVRVPDHPVALALLRLAGPLAVTSANISEAANTRTAQEVMVQLGGRVDAILDGGETPGGLPSTVVDCTTANLKILREGPISEGEIRAALT